MAQYGSQIGGGVGGAAGMAMGGPSGAMIGSSAGSMLGGLFDKGDKGPGHGYEYGIRPQWDHTEANQNRLSDLYNSDISRANAGQLPSGYDTYLNSIGLAKRRNLYQDYFGNGGTNPGIFQGSMDAGAVMGLGPKQGMAQTQKLYNDYHTQSNQIDDLINEYRLGAFHGSKNSAMAGLSGLSQGPASDLIQWTSPAESSGDGGALMGTLGGMMGGFKGFGGGSKMTTPSYGGGILGSQGPQGNAFSQYKPVSGGPVSGGFNFPTPGFYR